MRKKRNTKQANGLTPAQEARLKWLEAKYGHEPAMQEAMRALEALADTVNEFVEFARTTSAKDILP